MIRTRRLVLRRPVIADLPAVHAIFSNADAMRYWSNLPHTEEESRDFLTGMINANPETSFDFVVEYNGRVIGKAGCWRLPEVGYIFHPDAWGQGFATEALRAVLPAAFETYPELDEITADVDPRNAASNRILRRLGFRETGRASKTFLIGETWCDSVYYALKRGAEEPLV